MAKNESAKDDSNKCPKCEFAGKDSDKKKFSEETIATFPKGYAKENRPQIDSKTGKFVTDKNKQIIFDKISRCPVCGYSEDDKIQ